MSKKKRVKRIRKEKIDWKLLIVCLFISFFVCYIGSGFTVIDDWYYSVKPVITPPDYIFPVVWTILFFLIGLSFYFSIKKCSKELQNKMVVLYSINFAFNIAWSFFYFTAHSPLFAFITIILLILSIISLMLVNWKKARTASYLLIPYLIWVCFAGILNFLTILNVLR
ncbi:tryptophan-rich sensory protein [Candidatus Pacearchaeota archaeon]|nr:tryptophan-rich sensory protein [Candidatus Pacearchaeota archaeon]